MNAEQIQNSVSLTRNRERLDYEEDRMKKGLQMFAASLRDIRSSGCWEVRSAKGNEPEYGSFDDYCRRKLGFSEQRACQIIKAGDTVKCLQEAVEGNEPLKVEIGLLPEKAVRALREVSVKEAAKIVKKISKKEKITEAAINRELGKPPKPKSTPTLTKCPHCGKQLAKI